MTVARWSDLRFLGGIALPTLTLANTWQRPDRVAVGVLATWLLIALLEFACPPLARSPGPAGPVRWLPWLLRLYVPLQLVLIAAGMAAAARGDWPLVAGLAFGIGFIAGAQGITYAHELGHSRRRFDRGLAWLLMTAVNYGHFMVEHYRGHHVRAATRDDPATARSGESLWRFLPRTLAGSWVHAWQLEAQRVAQQRRGWWRSPLAWSTAINVAVVLVLAALAQWKMLAFWLLQSAMAVWLLETVNYIEHYGLQRDTPQGRPPAAFGVVHAWNADHLVTNSLLVNLQRHAWKPYPELEALPGPQLPTGYAGCLLLAAVPPLWFGLMHPRLQVAQP